MKVTGMSEALLWLESTGPGMARKLAGDMNFDVATAIAESARAGMPVASGDMKAATVVKRGKRKAGIASAIVRCGQFYWRFLENGQGPDGVEHAMFLKAREKVLAQMDRVHFAALSRRLQKALK